MKNIDQILKHGLESIWEEKDKDIERLKVLTPFTTTSH